MEKKKEIQFKLFFNCTFSSFNLVSSCHIIVELNINEAFIKRDEDGFGEKNGVVSLYFILLLQTKQ